MGMRKKLHPKPRSKLGPRLTKLKLLPRPRHGEQDTLTWGKKLHPKPRSKLGPRLIKLKLLPRPRHGEQDTLMMRKKLHPKPRSKLGPRLTKLKLLLETMSFLCSTEPLMMNLSSFQFETKKS